MLTIPWCFSLAFFWPDKAVNSFTSVTVHIDPAVSPYGPIDFRLRFVFVCDRGGETKFKKCIKRSFDLQSWVKLGQSINFFI